MPNNFFKSNQIFWWKQQQLLKIQGNKETVCLDKKLNFIH